MAPAVPPCFCRLRCWHSPRMHFSFFFFPHLWRPSRVPRFFFACSPVDFATLEATARYCAKKAIGDRWCIGVTSNPPAFLGKRILLIETCSQRTSIVQNNGDQFPSWGKTSAFQISFTRLILSARILAFCSLSLVGSWLFRAVVVISVRYSPSLTVPTIMRPLGGHFTSCVISSRILVVLSGVGRCFSSVSLSLAMTSSASPIRAVRAFPYRHRCRLAHGACTPARLPLALRTARGARPSLVVWAGVFASPILQCFFVKQCLRRILCCTSA